MSPVLQRRAFITLVGGAAVAWPLSPRAQQSGKVRRVGFLALPSRPEDLYASRFGGFARGMRELGYIEGENVTIEWRFANGEVERIPGLVAELIDLKVEVIVASATPVITVVQGATKTIPIVMATANDPVGTGLVESLARPGGNTTGLSNLSTDLSPKLVELLRAIAPKVSRIAMLVNPKNGTHAAILDSQKAAAATIKVDAVPAWAATGAEMENAFSTIDVEKAGAIIVAPDAVFMQHRHQIAELAIKYRLPTIFSFREHVEAGGLMSYGQNLSENYRRSASYVDKIFKGAKPTDLPVEQTTKIEMLINGKTAKILGLTIPVELLVLSDKVVE
jgi:ABC-type uncharacterized transport system substrate-binding protein